MATPASGTFEKEVSALALFISLPQIIAAPFMVGLQHLLQPHNIFFELKEILDFIVISFPLTLSIAVLFIIIEKGKFNPFYLLLVVGGAALLSNLLHGLVHHIPSVHVKETFAETFNNTSNGGNAAVFIFVRKVFGIYWEIFGPILFIQSVCIGIYAGYRYATIKNKEEAKKKSEAASQKK